MICSIMQPTFLPWAGYFNLISKSDVFVFLDDAQYQKNSWHNRNRILHNHQPFWITVPVRHKKIEQTIRETLIDNSKNWNIKRVKLLHQTYSKHPFFEYVMDICDVLENNEFNNLAELNILLIHRIINLLDIDVKIYMSSEMNIDGKRSDRLINILDKIQATQYLSPIGASDYLKADKFEEITNIALTFQKYKPPSYKHYRHNDFESHLSILDVLANIGEDATKTYIN